MRRLLFAFTLLVTCSVFYGQNTSAGTGPDSIHDQLKEQIKDLYQTRGMPPAEIDSLLNIFESAGIHSDNDIARILEILYPANSGIAVLFFFYRNGSLHRVLFEPGVIKEKKDIPIRKEELQKIGDDITKGLGIYTLQNDRAPKLRSSVIPKEKNTSIPVLSATLSKASHLLLPEKLDTSYRHLVIIPALNIGSIPFHLLTPYKDDAMLIDRCSYTISPGIFDLLLMRWKWLKRNGVDIVDLFSRSTGSGYRSEESRNRLYHLTHELSFFVEDPLFISNPAYPVNTPYIFPDLPGAKKEVRNAVKYLEKYKILDGSHATKDSVMKYIDGCDVLYFATHGIASTENPMGESFLVLSGDDPFLRAKDIMNLRYKQMGKRFPGLVILSACQTGLGKAVDAGVAGLARSFLLAGSNNVIMSLWNVDDEATAFLMNRFFLYLQNTKEFLPSEPLRKAIVDTKKKYPHPSQWASFSVFGIDY